MLSSTVEVVMPLAAAFQLEGCHFLLQWKDGWSLSKTGCRCPCRASAGCRCSRDGKNVLCARVVLGGRTAVVSSSLQWKAASHCRSPGGSAAIGDKAILSS